MAKKKAARPTAKKATKPVKKSARKAEHVRLASRGTKGDQGEEGSCTKGSQTRLESPKVRTHLGQESPPGRRSRKKVAARKAVARRQAAKAAKPVRSAKASKPAARKAAPRRRRR